MEVAVGSFLVSLPELSLAWFFVASVATIQSRAGVDLPFSSRAGSGSGDCLALSRNRLYLWHKKFTEHARVSWPAMILNK